MDCAVSRIEAVRGRDLTATGTPPRATLSIGRVIGMREISEDELWNEVMVLCVLGFRSSLHCRHRVRTTGLRAREHRSCNHDMSIDDRNERCKSYETWPSKGSVVSLMKHGVECLGLRIRHPIKIQSTVTIEYLH